MDHRDHQYVEGRTQILAVCVVFTFCRDCDSISYQIMGKPDQRLDTRGETLLRTIAEVALGAKQTMDRIAKETEQ